MTTDPASGLQRERTYLSWRRTALSLAAVGVLVLHESPTSARVAYVVAGALALALAATAVVTAEWRFPRRQTAQRSGVPSAALVAAFTAGTTILPLTLLLTQLGCSGRS